MLKRPGSWLGICLSLVLMLWLLRSFNLHDAFNTLVSADYLYLLPAALFILSSFILRALRWRVLFLADARPAFISSFVALTVGYLLNNVLPARAGEVGRSYILARRAGLTLSATIATVMVERVAELVITLALATALLLLGPLPSWTRSAGIVLAPVTLLSLAFLLVLKRLGVRRVGAILSTLRFLPGPILSRLTAFGEEFARTVSSLRPANVTLFLLWSIPIWLSETLILATLSKAFNLPFTMLQALFVLIVVGIGTAIPSAPGAVGTYEFFFTSALAAVGISGGPKALTVAIAIHAVTFFGTNILGAVCMAFSGMSLWRDAIPPPDRQTGLAPAHELLGPPGSADSR